MKIFTIVLLIVAVNGALASFLNLRQTIQIGELKNQVACLEQGRIWAGKNLCATPLKEEPK